MPSMQSEDAIHARKIHYARNYWTHEQWLHGECNRYLFSFGACDPLHLLVYELSLDAALEDAALWLSEHAPGYIMEHYGAEHCELIAEAAKDAGLTFDEWSKLSCGDGRKNSIVESAEADLTYTESGLIASHEWQVTDNPSRDDLLTLAHR